MKKGTKDNLVVAICGLWHLGLVTAACCSRKDFRTIGYDPSEELVANLNKKVVELYEPKLSELISNGLDNRVLSFTADIKKITHANIVWICFDTPVDERDNADEKYIYNEIVHIAKDLKDKTILIISSQIPLGSSAKLKEMIDRDDIDLAILPENLNLGNGVDSFSNQDRIVIGINNPSVKETLEPFIKCFCNNILWMSPESAEMTKHAVNSFLAKSIAFTNELATISQYYGANFFDVEEALRLEPRIGKKAYIRPGEAFAGGTLARDLKYLINLASSAGLNYDILQSVIKSNNNHKLWVYNNILKYIKKSNLHPKKIIVGFLGVSYKENSNTIRRSGTLELINLLIRKKIKVKAYDRFIKQIEGLDKNYFSFVDDAIDCFNESDIIVLMNASNSLVTLNPSKVDDLCKKHNRLDQKKVIIDQKNIMPTLKDTSVLKYLTFGKD